MNEAVTVIGSNALVLDTAEETLGSQVGDILRYANGIVIETDEQYAQAGECAKEVKRLQKQVKDYWEPLRVSTKKAYDDVLARKKEMTDPLDAAEKALKSKIGTYAMAQEQKRREQEAALRRQAEVEMKRKLAEAEAAEAKGDAFGAECALAEAEVMEGVVAAGTISTAPAQVKGVTKSKSWRITSIDNDAVPTTFSGMMLRPVDESAVMALIKASKGQIQIPGIKYEETVNVSIRA